MSDLLCQQSQLLKHLEPLLNDMPACALKHMLFEAFWSEEAGLVSIEQSFQALTAMRPEPQALCQFFASWSLTHHHLGSLAGLGNRLTLLARSGPDESAAALYRACGSLQRITDEELGASGNTPYPELFDNMASTICGSDQWRLKANSQPSAQMFRYWIEARCLRDRDLSQGLLLSLIHRIYSHGEARFIGPLYRQWLTRDLGMPVAVAWATVAWAKVQAEVAPNQHYVHALEALAGYADAMSCSINQHAAREIFVQYLQRKARVMRDCLQRPSA
ncbi:hypothetical protein J4P02_09600 [Pseudomonas sp. NFXW11]|uniref:hypothetical protein n=1 Tax=Pseudomonas sp. NFXW11 TaxID=2819531 RepID=UPI003CFAAF64